MTTDYAVQTLQQSLHKQPDQLPYSFAKRHGVIFKFDGAQTIIVLRDNAPLPALNEARRIAGVASSYLTVTDDEFARLLAGSY